MSWDDEFDEPIILPNGRKARTLREAGKYIQKLPKDVYLLPEWQAAMSALIVNAEHKGPTMFARIGMMQAINRDQEKRYGPGKRNAKEVKWTRAKLKRDL